MVKSFTLLLAALSFSTVFASSDFHDGPRRLTPRHNTHQRRSSKPKRCISVAPSNSTITTASTSDPSVDDTTTSTKSRTSKTKTTTSSSTSTATAASSSATDDSGSDDTGSDDTGSDDSGSDDTGSGSSNSTTSGSGSTSTNSTGPSSSSSSAGDLFPSSGIAGWTLSSGGGISNVKSFAPFTDSTFTLVSNMKALPHPVSTEDDKPAMTINFKKGAYDLKTDPDILGGFSFYTPGPAENTVDMVALKASEVSFGYSVKFTSGFQFNKGGKLPGLFGGTNWDVGATCSGGQHNSQCFSTRMMFRPDGQGELYLYIPPDSNRANLCGPNGTGQCAAPDAGVTYGASVGTGNFHFAAGDWTNIREVIHLNTPGQKDGWAAVYVNGASTPSIYIDDIVFGESEGTYFQGQQMQSFFGGHDPTWGSPQEQTIYFADFTMVITQTF
ncbi:hypothetical protein FRB97_004571 [Tulasnella sp. 331]|nr:hypothetical protein FRB97_004571 [Tulasnella sp. 331]